jgi:spore germination cell wall hydrolase CwlJ-like protein
VTQIALTTDYTLLNPRDNLRMSQHPALAALSDTTLLALLLHGECRGESPVGQLAVSHVVLNRFGRKSWYGSTIRDVILKPCQFSYFNELTTIPAIDPVCQAVAYLAMSGYTIDPSRGASHYWSRAMRDVPPAWALDMVETIRMGGHVFCRTKSEATPR